MTFNSSDVKIDENPGIQPTYGPKDPAETNFKKKMNFSELVELGPNSETIGNVRTFEKI